MRPHLASLVEEFRRHGTQTAIVSYRGNRRYATSYQQLADLSARFAAELARRRIGYGDRVVIWGENSAEWIAAFFGCLLRGVIAVPLDFAGSPSFADRVVAEVTPSLIAGDRRLLATLLNQPPLLAFSAFQSDLPTDSLSAVDAEVTGETPLQIIFTSGTTSEPKGVVHTHRNVLASVAPIEREMQKYLRYERFVHPLRFLHSLPLSHVFGQFMGLWLPSLLAAEVHFESQLEPSRLMATIRRERISVLAAVPRVLDLLKLHLLTTHPELNQELAAAKGESAWRHWWRFRSVHRAFGLKFWAIVCGGASLPPELEEFWNTLGFALIQGYGLTETAALVTLNHPFKIGKGTIGKPLPGREVRIGDNGEILVRGEMLSKATWQGGRLQQRDEGWLNTGDIAAQDPSGELRFLGRKNDIIVTAAGLNIHVADLEAALGKQAGVITCALVPCAIAQSQAPVAVVIFSGSDDLLEQAVRQANHDLADYQQIRAWLRWPEVNFPYTSTGKLLRRRIADWACAQLAGQETPGGKTQSSDPLLQLIAEITGAAPANTSDASLLSADLRLDSLGTVQLQSTLERRLGIELPDNAMESVKTLGELRRLLDQRTAAHRSPAPVMTPGRASGAGEPPQNPTLPAIHRADTPDRHLYPYWPWWSLTRLLRVLFLEAVMRPLVWLLAAPRVITGADLPAGPLLIVANHVSTYDAALVLYALPPKLRRRIAIAMSGEMLLSFRKGRRQGEFTVSWLGPFAWLALTALFNVFPLPRSTGFRRSFAHSGLAMDRGYSVLVFPEGHRSEDGRMRPFRPGIGLLARESRVPVLPVAIKGLGELRENKLGWFRSGKIVVQIGDSLPVSEMYDPASFTRELEEAVGAL